MALRFHRRFSTRRILKAAEEAANRARSPPEVARNAYGIQLLSPGLHRKVFGKRERVPPNPNARLCLAELKKFGLCSGEPETLPECDFELPGLTGENIDEHFKEIAEQQGAPYRQLADALARARIPERPASWIFQEGWTKYRPDGKTEQVPYPDSQALVLDVEVCVREGENPVLATAASPLHWYSWCSTELIKFRDGDAKRSRGSGKSTVPDVAAELGLASRRRYGTNQMIPVESRRDSVACSKEPKLIVGHNVAFDRAKVKEQYWMNLTPVRFLDTMSMHIAVSGFTSYQRALWMGKKSGSSRKKESEKKETGAAKRAKMKMRGPPVTAWMDVSSRNSLADVYQLYVRDAAASPEEVEALDKTLREVFTQGSLADVVENFQILTEYCAKDVEATFLVAQKLWPVFVERFPHPVTFAGMLEMGTAYLPVNSNWERYLSRADSTYRDLEAEVKFLLLEKAYAACQLMHNEAYKEDPWLWNLDWSTQDLKFKKAPKKEKNVATISCGLKRTEAQFPEAVNAGQRLYSKQPFLCGYPAWFRELCDAKHEVDNAEERETSLGGHLLDELKSLRSLGAPLKLTTSTSVTPKLLRLTWNGFPLHFDKENGWGYLVPRSFLSESVGNPQFPVRSLQTYLDLPLPAGSERPGEPTTVRCGDEKSLSDRLDELWMRGSLSGVEQEEFLETLNKLNAISEQNGNRSGSEIGEGVGVEGESREPKKFDIGIPGCDFYRLPHKNGEDFRVGNPLAKDFLSKIEDGTLGTAGGSEARTALEINARLTYWRNARDRIVTSQTPVWLKKKELTSEVLTHIDGQHEGDIGAILPKVVVAGTVTRRAVEPTWLTASNASKTRVGSELKGMVQAPPGKHFVGADVDSEELWIASLIGDTHSLAPDHGATPIGWMTLQGKKSQGTDMHSKTAQFAGITRDQAKILNYGRIFGAGRQFAQLLLQQFNKQLTVEEAREKAANIYAQTKGVKGYKLTDAGRAFVEKYGETVGLRNNPTGVYSMRDVKEMFLASRGVDDPEVEFRDWSDLVARQAWMNGTESAMFNRLEEIAESDQPTTPVLGARISKALEPLYVDRNFMTSRVNWVVQSSAVDYLHLLLVAMRWLLDAHGIAGRLAISIHDEVHYMVSSDDRYRAALALQISNLLTRSMFAYKLGLKDLPQCVAFFSSVEVDKVLRKESGDDCVTPSNPHGLSKGYGIPPGESLDIHQILEICRQEKLERRLKNGSQKKLKKAEN